jgi:hexulose-6-phosphate isomerase
MPADEAMTIAQGAGFRAFELCVGDPGPLPLTIGERDCDRLRSHADRLGLAVPTLACGMGWEFPLSSPDAAIRNRGKEIVEQTLQIAQWLGAGAVLTVPGVVTPQVTYDVAIENALSALQDLVPAAERFQVAIAIENVWNKFLLSPVEMRDFIDQCESAYVGAYVDTGNVMAFGYPEQWLRILDTRVRAVHVKDFNVDVATHAGFCAPMQGDVDWNAVAHALHEIGFDGTLTAEMSVPDESLDAALAQAAAGLEAIIAL